MLINLRNALMAGKRLPYDAEVEYLAANVGGDRLATPYIDTGIHLTGWSSVAIGYQEYDTSQYYPGIFSSRKIPVDHNTSYTLLGNDRLDCGYGGTASWTRTTNVRHLMLQNTSGALTITLDGSVIHTVNINNFTSAETTILFADRQNTGLKGAIYYFRIWDENGTLVRDFIPVRKGTVGYMYDRVSGKIFGNAGTGDFVLGQDVVPVEYIESHGGWIDTGVKVADPSTISISVDSDGVTPFGVIHNNVGAGSWLGVNSRTSATEVAVYSKDFNSRGLFEFSAGRHTFKWDGATGFQIDGVSKSSFTATVGTDAIGSISWPLFGRYDFAYDSIGGYGSSMFYGGNIEISGISARKFLPVRVGTEGALIDTLTRRIYRNKRAGYPFTYGNDLPYPIPAS